ncbi:hypothetical protein DBR43_31240 [Pedobacter sp. KBW06]|uniref:hypothetical protein n=1 Tax=Pedobacter sp. KBW06 TaxID=2153359 RepID=UPI000F5B164F|nr:hypothetical protein [Pedobacter sp. KBW06]RQO65319.1 hypothetical protein DBR43_31240 [Pedobacter sp. KBW06]
MKNNLLIINIVILTIVAGSCKKGVLPIKKENTASTLSTAIIPTLTTTAFTSITTVSASTGGMISANGGASVTERGICYSLSPNPTIASSTVAPTSVSGSGEFVARLSGLTASTKYYVRAFAKNSAGIAYGNEIELNTADIISATFSFTPMFIIGSTLAATDVEVLTDGGNAVTEKGICWSTSANPTIANNKLKHNSTGTGKFRTMIKGLNEKTDYHVRAYAVNAKGVSYSADVSFKTIPAGKMTYTFNKATNPTPEQLAAYDRLQMPVDSASWYIKNFTSATKHVYLNYDPGVATADANNEGWMRFGASTGVQNIRTMLHEMNHTLGTGTSAWWSGKIVGGKYQGEHVNALLKKIQNSNVDVQLSGDTQHWWPYGLNQNSEVTSSWDYVYNCLIIEAMRKDGMTSYSGAYTP